MQRSEFTQRYVASGLSANSARSYITYLTRVDRLCGGLDRALARDGSEVVIDWAERQPADAFGTQKDKRDSLSALRKYVELTWPTPMPTIPSAGREDDTGNVARLDLHDVTGVAEKPRLAAQAIDILRDARKLAVAYYSVTGKPLGVTGELAELAAHEVLGIDLADARNPGFDGWMYRGGRALRVQIKGRAVAADRKYLGRCPSIKCDASFDVCHLVLLDRATMEPFEIWEADEADIATRLDIPGSKARNIRKSMGISQFIGIGRCIWRANGTL